MGKCHPIVEDHQTSLNTDFNPMDHLTIFNVTPIITALLGLFLAPGKCVIFACLHHLLRAFFSSYRA